ncbi:hypothetical protein, partial [Faecalibaculum rodentium]|uniref:hypothetical protein n=1 Tax=Faecalibaculum rodentium TaxID=1702221 RepID=UPI0026166E29
ESYPPSCFYNGQKEMSGEYQWNLRTFFPFTTRKKGCNQPADRKTGLTVTAPLHFIQIPKN